MTAYVTERERWREGAGQNKGVRSQRHRGACTVIRWPHILRARGFGHTREAERKIASEMERERDGQHEKEERESYNIRRESPISQKNELGYMAKPTSFKQFGGNRIHTYTHE